MGKKKEKAIEIRKDEKEEPKVISKSEKRRTFEALIEAYKIQNPVKYEHKKARLEEKLKNL